MKFNIRRYQELFIIFLLLLAFIIFELVTNSNVDESVHRTIFQAEVSVSAAILAILAMTVTITSDTYASIISSNGNRRLGDAIIIAILILISSIGTVIDDDGNTFFISTCVVGLMIGSFIGGPRMSIIVAVGSLLILLIPLGFTTMYAIYVVSVLAIAIICGYICRKGCDKRTYITTYLASLVMIFVMMTCVYLMDNLSMGDFIALLITASIILTMTVSFYIRTEGLLKYKVGFEKNKNDLALASKIQMSAVPHDFPSSKTLESYGMMEPAIDVGGDFYDYFSIKQNLVAIVIGDVSDKGLPAALFMMKAKGTIRSIAMVEHEPNRIMMLANRELCRDNVAEQFVSLWIGILDTDTGILRHSNAGHTPPYIRRANGTFEKMHVPKGLIVGVEELSTYRAQEIVMDDGDTLFVYTDGVNEAFNASNEEYGHERLCSILNKSADLNPKELVSAVRADISSFTGKAPVSDDITMLCIRTYRDSYSSVTVKAVTDNLRIITDSLEEKLLSSGCPEKAVMKMEIVAEEIFVNICSYGYRNAEPGDATMLCRYSDGEVKLIFYNKGEKFDPVSRDELLVDEDINNWKIGGFGIHMIKKLVDHANYKYLGGRNILTVWKRTE